MRQEKQLLLDEIKEKIEESSAFILTKYQNFTADKARNFRDILAKSNGDFEVVRKRVFIKAAEAAGIKLEASAFEGHVAVIFAKEDVVEVSKAALKFGEDTESAVEIIGGHLEGQFYNAADVKTIARLPGKQEMQAQFLGLLEAPLSQTLATLEAILTSLPHCLENKCNKDSENK